MGRPKKETGPPSQYHKHVTNRNRKKLEERYGIEIPNDVEWILVGEAMTLYMEDSVDTVIRKSSIESNHDYGGIELID